MKARNRVKNRRHVWMALFVCIGTALVLIGAKAYVDSLRSSLMNQTIANVLTVTEQQEEAFNRFIVEDRERLHSFAAYFSRTDSRDEAEIWQRLTAFAEVNANYTVANLSTGVCYNNKTDEIYQMDEEEREVYAGLEGAGIRDPYVSLYSPAIKFGYYENFVFLDGARGIFQKSYDCTRVEEEFSLSFYDGKGVGYVVNQEGDILLRSRSKAEGDSFDNIFDLLTESSDERLGGDSFREVLNHREPGIEIFSGENGDYIYTYVPVESVEEWYLISIIPTSVVTSEADGIIRNSQITIMILAVVFLLSLGVLFFIWRSSREIKEKDQEIEYRKRQFDIFGTYLANNTDDVYLMLSAQERRAEYVSANVERVLGVSEEQVLEDIRAFGRASYISRQEIGFAELEKMKPGDSINAVMSERVHQKTGKHMWFRESIYCVSLQGASKIVVYLSDRTKERETQDTLTQALDMAQVANRAKSVFLSNVSHDIRTPMNAIMGLVTLLEQDARNPEHVLEYTQRIGAASHHLLGLINDVLDMNKIEGGNATLNITNVDIADMIDELNVIIRPQARAKDQTFKIFASAFNYEHLLGDRLRIDQILINILSNAVKYTPNGGHIEMYINELPGIAQEYSRVQFIVQDNGQGMSEEYLKVIFEPFTREKNTRTDEIQGTGLGMAITKSLVDLMGGSIQVESKVGEGSKFTLELDLHIRELEDDPAFWNNHNVSRMIVADDDEYVCRNIVKAMEDTGVSVEYATSGERAVQMMRTARENKVPYDLILLDWKMPDLNGLETARLIRKNYPDRIPILLFTSYDWSEIQQEAMEVGVDHFLQKPFFMYSFKEAIRRVMRGRTEQQVSVKQESVVDGKHILVVDDIEVNRMILVKILGTLGATCDIAVNGQEAVDTFTKSEPGDYDIILMDVQMPILDGYAATRAIRASSHPQAKSIAIVAMTANAFVDDVRDALASGMDAHVAKPIVLEQLKATLQEVLERKDKCKMNL